MATEPALLILEDGTVFQGQAWGARGKTLGELVFATGMTGYQETLTDPSYHRQIVLMTSPHIGNTGVNSQDAESDRIWVAGFVVREPARVYSNWRAEGSLDNALERSGIVGISGVDTRAITRHIRSVGSMKAGIYSGAALPAEISAVELASRIEEVAGQPDIHEGNLAEQVSSAEAYVVGPSDGRKDPLARVVAVDLGIKSMTPQRLAERGVEVHVVPATATIEEIEALAPQGVFFSNGPGDPGRASREVELLRAVLDRKIPFFGICFGNQILGRSRGWT